MSFPALMVLLAHGAIIGFNIAGLILIPLGAWRGWRWVRGFVWRLLHLLSLTVVAVQALAGRACFLTLWQTQLEGGSQPTPMIAGWINRLIFWPLPLWVFAVAYVLIWVYVLFLWWRVPPRAKTEVRK